MNNYCIHLKKRKEKPYCNILKEEIPFSRCRECGNKEYKSINHQIRKSNNYKGKMHYRVHKMKNQSNKLAKIERNRFSVFTNKDKCFMCSSTYNLTWNEIYRGRNRINSMKYGFCLRMCIYCHSKYQDNTKFNDYWHSTAQKYWENNIGTRDEFINVFRRNYLEK